ncbi:MAG: YlbF family regulator [Halanaerobiales bacterium]|nr:YlbF family regulator [Halanaerobiales bacterium]
MAVYDQAHLIAQELKNSPEYQEYMKVKGEIEKEDVTKKMLLDFQRKQIKLQSKQMMGQKLEDTEMDKLRKLAEVVQMNRLIGRYLELEQRMGIMLNDLQKIIFGSLEIGFKELFEEVEGK